MLAAAWSVVLLALSRTVIARVLGIKVTRSTALASACVGIGIGALVVETAVGRVSGFTAALTFAVTSTLAGLGFVAIVGLLSRSRRRTVAVAPTPTSHPLRTVTFSLARGRRYLELTRIATRHGLGPLAKLSHRRSAETPAMVGAALRGALEDSGPIFVKFGQVLATRTDFLPPAIAVELAVLHDRSTTLAATAIHPIIEAELRHPIHEIFSRFDDEPLGAASLAQVHAARLRSGEEVVVKVQRPGIDTQVEQDLRILLRLAQRTEETAAWAKAVGIVDLARGFAENLREELDFRCEGQHLALLHEAMSHSSHVRVPRPYPMLTTRRVLVEERIFGARLSSLSPADVEAHGYQLGRTLLDSFLTQLFQIGVFHVDPHPGNVLVLGQESLALLDFGSVGRLSAPQQRALSHALLAIARRRPRLLRDALLELCPPADAIDIDALDRDLGRLITVEFSAPSQRTTRVVEGLFRIMVRYRMVVDPQLAGMFRALATLEGTLTTLSPDFDLLAEATRSVSRSGVGLPGAVQTAADLTDDILELLPLIRRIPRDLDRLGRQAERGELTLRVRLFGDQRDVEHVDRVIDRALLAFFSGSIGLISVLLLALASAAPRVDGAPLNQVLGYAGLTAATVLGLRVLATINRSET